MLRFPPAASLAPRQRSAVLLVAEFTAAHDGQLRALVDRVGEIIAMLEQEIGR